jgi:hypothetical protein
MLRLLKLFFGSFLRMLYSRRDLFLQNLRLRQQLAVLRSRHPRPRFSVQDELFGVAALRWWSGWKRVLVVVTPETVVRWHRAGFRHYWTWLSRHQIRTGRKRVSRDTHNSRIGSPASRLRSRNGLRGPQEDLNEAAGTADASRVQCSGSLAALR